MVPAGSRRIPRVLRYSGGGPARLSVSPTGLSPSTAGVSTPLGYASPGFLRPLLLPRRARRHAPGLGSSAFARHYSRNRSLFLLLRVLRCFGSPGCPRTAMCSPCGDERVARRVPPFGNPGIQAHVQLPRAYRRLSRPSSSSGSKASAARLANFRPPDGSSQERASLLLLLADKI